MAKKLNPDLTFIKDVEELPTASPSAIGDLLIYENNILKKFPRSNIDNMVAGELKTLLPSDAAPTVVGKYGLLVGTYTNLVPIIHFGETEPTSTPITTVDGFYNAVYFDGTNFTQIKTEIANKIGVEGGAASYESSILQGNNIALSYLNSYEAFESFTFDGGNFYINDQGVAVANADCLITDYIDVSDSKYVLPFFVIYNSGFYAFYDEDQVKISVGQVPADKVGEKIRKPDGAVYFRASCYKNEIENPSIVLLGNEKYDADISAENYFNGNKSAFRTRKTSFSSWNTSPSQFLKVNFPDVDLNNGAFFSFKIKVFDINNNDPQSVDRTIEFDVNMLCYADVSTPPIVTKHFIKKITGNSEIISSIKIMVDADKKPCVVIQKPNNINVYHVEISDVSVFFGFLENESKDKLTVQNLFVSNEPNVTGYTLVKDYSYVISENTDGNPYAGITILLFGDSETDGFDNGNFLNTYPDFIKAKFGTDAVIKFGHSGATLARNPNPALSLNEDSLFNYIVAQNPDIVIFMAGVNDYQTNVVLGDVDSTDRATLSGAFNYLHDYLMTRLPNLKLFYCTQAPYFYQPAWSGVAVSGRTKNTLNHNLRDYYESAISVCKQRSIPVIDLNLLAGWYDVAENISKNFTSDGLHLSTKGYDEITTIQKNEIDKHF